MSRVLAPLAGVAVVLALIVGPGIVAVRQQAQTRNFRVVRDGVLYRSGQMSTAGLSRIFHDYGIRTVICLRDGRSAAEQAEEEVCARKGITFIRLPPRNWGDGVGEAPVEENVRKFREVLADPSNYPILVHCFAGTHRTGAYCAIYRMEHEGWSNEQAIAEIKACGYRNLDEEWDILGYLEQYVPVHKWAPVGTNARAQRP
jgi:protein tyrosine/serine phosphatase